MIIKHLKKGLTVQALPGNLGEGKSKIRGIQTNSDSFTRYALNLDIWGSHHEKMKKEQPNGWKILIFH